MEYGNDTAAIRASTCTVNVSLMCSFYESKRSVNNPVQTERRHWMTDVRHLVPWEEIRAVTTKNNQPGTQRPHLTVCK